MSEFPATDANEEFVSRVEAGLNALALATKTFEEIADARTGGVTVVLALALPVLADQLLGVMVGFVDMALAGHVLKTDAHIAAMGSLAYLMWLLFTLFASVAIGATAVIARLVGGGSQREAAHAANQAFLLGLLFAVPIALLYGLGGKTLAHWLQLDGEAATLVGRYLMIVACSVPLVAIQRVGIAALRGAGDFGKCL